MIVTENMINALDAALDAAEREYWHAVYRLALCEAAKTPGVRTLADVDEVHVARTRI